MGDEQLYRVNVKLRRRGDAALESNRVEFSSEQYDDDEQLCQAVASELLEIIKSDREYLNDQDEGEN